ncbi:MAG TPA: O-antigen ligase family protein [Candidatus Acidoferrum sp.]|nr:O-antigen ligase family protein [Candidatus Acidoferrum sp.]
MVPDLSASHTGVGAVASASAAPSMPSQRRKMSGHTQLGEAYVSLLLFMVVYCARPEDWIPGLSSVPLAKIAGILALVAFVLSLGQIRQRLPPEIIFLILLTGQLFATVPMSPVWRGGALNTTLDFAKVVLIVLVMVMAVNTATRLRRLLFVQAASVAAISAVAVWKGRLGGERLQGVLNGNYSNPNDLAIAIVMSIPLCLALLFLSKSPLWRAVWALAMLVMTYAVLLTGSRGGFLALAITAGVCLWEVAIRGRRPYLLLLAVVAGIVLWIPSSAILGGRLMGTFDPKDSFVYAYASAEARQKLFWRSIEITAMHPLFGVGPGNFPEVSGIWHVTHNSYTQMSAEGGIPAFIFYVIILWFGFRNLRRTRKLSAGNREIKLLAGAVHASLAGFVVGSLFASYAYQFFPYFLVAYTTVLLRITKRYAAQSEKPEPATQMEPEHFRAEQSNQNYPGILAKI